LPGSIMSAAVLSPGEGDYRDLGQGSGLPFARKFESYIALLGQARPGRVRPGEDGPAEGRAEKTTPVVLSKSARLFWNRRNEVKLSYRWFALITPLLLLRGNGSHAKDKEKDRKVRKVDSGSSASSRMVIGGDRDVSIYETATAPSLSRSSRRRYSARRAVFRNATGRQRRHPPVRVEGVEPGAGRIGAAFPMTTF